MENMRTKEKNSKKAKRRLMLISLLITFAVIIIVLVILRVFVLGNSKGNSSYTVPDAYGFSGNILSTCPVYSDISLVIEEKDNCLYGVTLKNNESVSRKVFSDGLNYGEIKDFGIVISEYNNDNEKDFVYVNDKTENGYVYKFYTVQKNGNIIESDIGAVTANSKRASIKLTKSGDEYKYIIPDFYYDGYKVSAEIGKHELNEKNDKNLKTVSKTSKIAIEGKYDALPRKISVLKEIPEYMVNATVYLSEAEKIKCIETDLDGDKEKEYIVWFIKDNKTYVNLFDSSYNFAVNLFYSDDEKNADEVFEIADVDNDGIMEIITIKEKSLEIHRYNNGFYY